VILVRFGHNEGLSWVKRVSRPPSPYAISGRPRA
jgi:hypothetical protein